MSSKCGDDGGKCGIDGRSNGVDGKDLARDEHGLKFSMEWARRDHRYKSRWRKRAEVGAPAIREDGWVLVKWRNGRDQVGRGLEIKEKRRKCHG
jgi:hypothetical protein